MMHLRIPMLIKYLTCNCNKILKARSGRPPPMGEINLHHRWPNNEVGPLPDPMKRNLFFERKQFLGITEGFLRKMNVNIRLKIVFANLKNQIKDFSIKEMQC